ncbi:toxin-antitoxin system, antitoxin component [Halobacteriales archaeon QH_9_66_26]|nr:MAG: toxin-antitoxin system, antitoxin component [Halobacteriales archaeon QH_9_66_26]
MADYAAEELQEARDALSDAAVLRDGGTDKAMINRLYYACFHAAQAVLYAKGVEPKSHRAVISLFGQKVVLKGRASGADGRFLNELRDYREQPDYDHDPIEANIEELFERAEEFVADMEVLV